jgi:hypothetical protein
VWEGWARKLGGGRTDRREAPPFPTKPTGLSVQGLESEREQLRRRHRGSRRWRLADTTHAPPEDPSSYAQPSRSRSTLSAVISFSLLYRVSARSRPLVSHSAPSVPARRNDASSTTAVCADARHASSPHAAALMNAKRRTLIVRTSRLEGFGKSLPADNKPDCRCCPHETRLHPTEEVRHATENSGACTAHHCPLPDGCRGERAGCEAGGSWYPELRPAQRPSSFPPISPPGPRLRIPLRCTMHGVVHLSSAFVPANRVRPSALG